MVTSSDTPSELPKTRPKTSLDGQIAALDYHVKKTNNLALNDALETLRQLKGVEIALHQQPPNTERVTKLLEALLVGS
jgi:hypothetical protein